MHSFSMTLVLIQLLVQAAMAPHCHFHDLGKADYSKRPHFHLGWLTRQTTESAHESGKRPDPSIGSPADCGSDHDSDAVYFDSSVIQKVVKSQSLDFSDFLSSPLERLELLVENSSTLTFLRSSVIDPSPESSRALILRI